MVVHQLSGGALTAVNSVVVAHAVQHLPAAAAGVLRAAPRVVVIGTRAGFHLFLQDQPTDTTLNLRWEIKCKNIEKLG